MVKGTRRWTWRRKKNTNVCSSSHFDGRNLYISFSEMSSTYILLLYTCFFFLLNSPSHSCNGIYIYTHMSDGMREIVECMANMKKCRKSNIHLFHVIAWLYLWKNLLCLPLLTYLPYLSMIYSHACMYIVSRHTHNIFSSSSSSICRFCCWTK